MTKRPARLFARSRGILPLLVCLAATPLVNAQEDAQPPALPDMQPPAPPDFVPPPPPAFSAPPLRSTAVRSTGNAQTVPAPTVPDRSTQAALDVATLSQQASPLVDESDPGMAETVGLIRIPEMGTNEVLEMLENFTGKPILRQQTLPAVKITFFSQGALTRGEAIAAIESLLALNGIGITTLGDKFLKAVPSAIINTQVPRPWEGSTLEAAPSQMIFEKIFDLDFLTPEEAVALIQPLMSQGAPIAFSRSNLILVTDALVNLQRIERLLPVLDRPARMRVEMLFFELQNLRAEEIVRRLQQMITGPLKNQLENNTSFEADDRTNQLVVFTHPSNVPLINKLVERLDIDVAPTTATRVYSIRYADATEVVNIIDQVVSGQREVRQEIGGDTTGQAAQAAQAARNAAVRQANQAVAAARAEATNLQFSNFLTIVPDERANTIVASGTHADLEYLQQLIDQIDTLLAQVRIEVVITEVGLTEDDARGIDTFGFSISGAGFFDFDLDDPNTRWTASPGQLYGVTFPASGTGTSASGPISWDGQRTGINFVLNAAKTDSRIKVLSAPTIVTTHNKEATVSVGQERPVITSVIRDTTAVTTTTATEQVQYRDIKLELKVTPLIGSDGIVQLEIDQTVQTIVGNVLVNGNEQPIVGTRSANSYVSVMDGQLIALGGLQSLDASNTGGRMAILGRIPLLGNLFSSKNISETRSELLIFIRPTIIRDTADANRDANQMIDSLEGRDDVRGYLEEGTFKEEKNR